MDLLLLSPVKSSPKGQYQPAPIGSSNGFPYQLASDLQLSDDSDSEDNLASSKPEVVVTADYCMVKHMPLLDGLTGDSVKITKENTDSISCKLGQLANDLQLSESSDSEDDSIKDLPLSNGQPQLNHVQFMQARKQSTDLMDVYPSNTNFHAPMLGSINSVAKDLELSDDSEDDFVEVQRVSNPQTKDMPLLQEFASEKDSGIMSKPQISSGVVPNKLPPEIKTKTEHIANGHGVTISSGNPNQFDGRQTTKPIKVAATIPVNQLNKDSKQQPLVPSLDPLPENFTLPVARKVRTSNFTKQQIENQIARGKELLQRKVDVQLSSDCRPKPHKRNASQMLTSQSSRQEGGMSVKHIQVAEPPKKKQRIMGKSVKSSESETNRLERKRPNGTHFKNKVHEEPLQKIGEGKANFQGQPKPHGINVQGKINSRFPTQNDEIHTGKNTQGSEPPRNQKISKEIIKSATERQATEDRGTYEHGKKHSKSARSENKDIKSEAPHSQSKHNLNIPLKSVKKEQSPDTSDVGKFKTLRREYIELMESLKRPAYLALQLKDGLAHKKMSGTKKEVVEIKKKILAIGKELKSESFQNQKRKLEQLEDQLESLKQSIKDSRKTSSKCSRKVVYKS